MEHLVFVFEGIRGRLRQSTLGQFFYRRWCFDNLLRPLNRASLLLLSQQQRSHYIHAGSDDDKVCRKDWERWVLSCRYYLSKYL